MDVGALSTQSPSGESTDPAPRAIKPAWKRIAWLTPARCRILFIFLTILGFLGHLRYLVHDCPLDLSGDEAHYWDWSRQLELSYYSKGPLVAYIIRASCAIFSDTMWAVRLPALIFAAGTSVLTYLLALKLFKSDRLALGANLLYLLAPLFAAGSVLMTIDPPFFFCWALATYLAAHVIFDGRRWLWPVIGVVVGVGFLAKYAMFLWPIGLVAFAVMDKPSRAMFKGVGPWIAVLIALLFTTPILLWNARHGWVTFMHVTTQTGTDGGGKFRWANIAEFLVTQLGVVGPVLFVMMGCAVAYAFGKLRVPPDEGYDENRRAMRFLAAIGLSLFGLTTLVSLVNKVQANWPAPAYFTLMILTAYFLSTRLQNRRNWKHWRGWFWGTAIIGVLMLPLVHDMSIMYPIAQRIIDRVNAHRSKKHQLAIRTFDPSVKLRGWAEMGARVSREMKTMPEGTFIVSDDYQRTAELAFYTENQPKTYYAGSYFAYKPGRLCQYDMWPDRSLEKTVEGKPNPLLGHDAIFVGYITDDVKEAFDRVEHIEDFEIRRDGIEIRTFRLYRCENFKGMQRPATVKH